MRWLIAICWCTAKCNTCANNVRERFFALILLVDGANCIQLQYDRETLTIAISVEHMLDYASFARNFMCGFGFLQPSLIRSVSTVWHGESPTMAVCTKNQMKSQSSFVFECYSSFIIESRRSFYADYFYNSIFIFESCIHWGVFFLNLE